MSPAPSLTTRLRAAAAAHPDRFDALIAAAVFVGTLPVMLSFDPPHDSSVVDGLTWPRAPLAALMTLPIALRRRHPLGVLLAISVGVVAAGLLGYATGPAAFAVILALATASYYRGRTTTVVGSVVGVAVLVALYALGPQPDTDRASSTDLIFSASLVVLALVTGDVLRGHRRALGDLEERNRRLEELRDVEKREAVAQDRVRIAQEVHDIVGHALAAITLQARAGQRQVTRDPERAGATFDQIEAVAGRALEETRQAVGIIRSGAERGELRPQPVLDDLPALVEAVSAERVRVSLRRDVTGDLPVSVQASAYRIVQESLANVVKHAGPATAAVELEVAPGGLRVSVRDDGAATQPAGEGHGLEGMRARARQVGGTLTAGPADGGGWLVEAWLPARPPAP